MEATGQEERGWVGLGVTVVVGGRKALGMFGEGCSRQGWGETASAKACVREGGCPRGEGVAWAASSPVFPKV